MALFVDQQNQQFNWQSVAWFFFAIFLLRLVTWAWEKHQTRLNAEFKQLLEPLIDRAINRVSGELRAQYPFIKFQLITRDKFVQRPDEIRWPHFRRPGGLADAAFVKTGARVVSQVLHSVSQKAVADFLEHEPEFGSLGTVQRDPVDEKFWASEERFRKTKFGEDPADWTDRRRSVFVRDGQRCRRCGQSVALETCHIHHIKRRSEGGDHALQNLVTLCRSCHALMDEHQGMKAIRRFFVSSRGTLHTRRCRFARGSREIWGSVPRLAARGYKPCKTCDPWSTHRIALESWKPEIAQFLDERVKIVVAEMFRQT